MVSNNKLPDVPPHGGPIPFQHIYYRPQTKLREGYVFTWVGISGPMSFLGLGISGTRSLRGVGMSRRCISRGIFITTCKRSCGKVMFSQVSVSLYRGGVGICGSMSFLGLGISGTRSLRGVGGYVQEVYLQGDIYYHLQTKLREGYVFTGVCLSTRAGWVSVVPCPFWEGWVSLVPGPSHRVCVQGMDTHPLPAKLGPGIPRKWAILILLEYCLVLCALTCKSFHSRCRSAV